MGKLGGGKAALIAVSAIALGAAAAAGVSALKAKQRGEEFAQAVRGLERLGGAGGSADLRPGLFETRGSYEVAAVGPAKLVATFVARHGPLSLLESQTPFEADWALRGPGGAEILVARTRGVLKDGGRIESEGELLAADWGAALSAPGAPATLGIGGGKIKAALDPAGGRFSWSVEGAGIGLSSAGAPIFSARLDHWRQEGSLSDPLEGKFSARLSESDFGGVKAGSVEIRSESALKGGAYSMSASLAAKGISAAAPLGSGEAELSVAFEGLAKEPTRRLIEAAKKASALAGSPSGAAELERLREGSLKDLADLARSGLRLRLDRLAAGAGPARVEFSGEVWLDSAERAGGFGLARQLGWSAKALVPASLMAGAALAPMGGAMMGPALDAVAPQTPLEMGAESGGATGEGAAALALLGSIAREPLRLEASYGRGLMTINGASRPLEALKMRKALAGADAALGWSPDAARQELERILAEEAGMSPQMIAPPEPAMAREFNPWALEKARRAEDAARAADGGFDLPEAGSRPIANPDSPR